MPRSKPLVPTTALLLLLVAATPALGQQAGTTQGNRALRRANTKVWIGIGLLAAGALMIPLTAANDKTAHDGPLALSGLGLAGAGTYMVWSGAKDQKRAVRPYTAFGVRVGRRKCLVIRRSW
jgi:hypothetical protein